MVSVLKETKQGEQNDGPAASHTVREGLRRGQTLRCRRTTNCVTTGARAFQAMGMNGQCQGPEAYYACGAS